MNWKLMIFTDAGFGALVKNHSIESHGMAPGSVIARSGVIQRHGTILDPMCAEIHRVCRSSLSAAENTAVAAVDVALRLQIFTIAIPTRRFEHSRMCHPKEFTIGNPPLIDKQWSSETRNARRT